MRSLCALGIAVLFSLPAAGATIPVRFPEGVTHGFLELRGLDGTVLAHGDQLQNAKNGEVDKRMVFRFKDGSTYDESVTFTQKEVFAVKTYKLKTKGPTFDPEVEISLDRPSGAYRVVTKDRKDEKPKVLEGKIDLPLDTYNGLILTVIKDLPRGAGEVVHFVAFTPQPRLIELALTPVGEDKIRFGDRPGRATRYVLKPQLGLLLKVFATLTGKKPEDSYAWIATDELPAFVAYEGALSPPGPAWRIEQTCPHRVIDGKSVSD